MCPIANLRSLSPPRAAALRELDLNMLLHAPVLALPMQEAAGNFLDISGFGNDGVPTDITRLLLPSGLRVGSFPGSFVGSYVSLGNDSSLDLTEAITAIVWIKATALDNVDIIMANTNGDTLTQGWGFRWSIGDTIRFFINQYGVNEAYISFTADSIWHLLVGTYDKTTVSIYVDGVKGTDDNYAGSIDYTTAIGATLGSAVRGNGLYKMTGFLALPRVIPDALSLTEIGNIYNREKHYFDVFNGNILARLLRQRSLAVIR